MKILFRDQRHKNDFYSMLKRMAKIDGYHLAVAYLAAYAYIPPNSIFNFATDRIRHECIYEPWQTSASVKTTRLAFNLWNGWAYEEDSPPEDRRFSIYYAVDNIFCNTECMPYFYQAIQLRFRAELFAETLLEEFDA